MKSQFIGILLHINNLKRKSEILLKGYLQNKIKYTVKNKGKY